MQKSRTSLWSSEAGSNFVFLICFPISLVSVAVFESSYLFITLGKCRSHIFTGITRQSTFFCEYLPFISYNRLYIIGNFNGFFSLLVPVFELSIPNLAIYAQTHHLWQSEPNPYPCHLMHAILQRTFRLLLTENLFQLTIM